MEITFKDIHKINFPIYRLISEEIESKDGLIYLGDLVLDDLNQPGNTLGERRLQTPHKLHGLRLMYSDIIDMLDANGNLFIDKFGFIFKYTKTKMMQIKYKKIIKVISRTNYSLLKLESVNFHLKVSKPPPLSKVWVGVIYLKDRPWLPYEYSEDYCMPKRRKI